MAANVIHTQYPLTAGTSARGFSIGLYLEHLEEASFLYEQRLALLDDPELTWRDLDDFEARFEAHIDALVLGEDLALAVCVQQAQEGDFGELHAAVRVFCRQLRWNLLQDLLDALDPGDEERLQAVGDALCQEMPEAWADHLLPLISSPEPALSQTAIRVAGYRRLRLGKPVLEALAQTPPAEALPCIRALGRLRYTEARSHLFNSHLFFDHPPTQQATAIALMRGGEFAAVEYCATRARAEDWTNIPLALGGRESDGAYLLTLAPDATAPAETLYALGLMGDPAAAPVLLEKLAAGLHPAAAATALNLITGADLYETTFIPEEIDEDMLFEDEKGALPEDEPPRGVEISVLSQDPDAWVAWWQAHQSAFRTGERYRNGKPYTPLCLVENLLAERSSRQVRQWACDELVIRYGQDFHFEDDLLVAEQLRIIEQYRTWAHANAASFREGQWYFAGQLMLG